MMQKSALRTTLLLAFLSMAPVAVQSTPKRSDAFNETPRQLFEAISAVAGTIDKPDDQNAYHLDTTTLNPRSICTLYPKLFGQMDTSDQDTLYQTFKKNVESKADEDTKATLGTSLTKIKTAWNSHTENQPHRNYGEFSFAEILAIANDLYQKKAQNFQTFAFDNDSYKKQEKTFSQAITRALIAYNNDHTENNFNNLKALLLKPILGGIQEQLERADLYRSHILITANTVNKIIDGKDTDLNTEIFENRLETHQKLIEDYEKIFGPTDQNASKAKAFDAFEKDIKQAQKIIDKNVSSDQNRFLAGMIAANNNLKKQCPNSFLEATRKYQNMINVGKFNSISLHVRLLHNALYCIQREFIRRGFLRAISDLFQQRSPTPTPTLPTSSLLDPRVSPTTPQIHTPTAPQQNAPPGTPQTGPSPHTPPKTKTRTIFLAPDRKSPSASSQSPVKPQPFHRKPATVQPLHTTQASPNNTPQTLSMHTQMPNTPPAVPRLDNVDGVRVTTPQISPSSHPPTPTQQTYAPISSWPNTPPAVASPGPFDDTLQRANNAYKQSRAQTRI